MIVEFEGRDWQFDQDNIVVDEWRELKRKYKMTPKGFQDGIDEADPDALTFMYWVLLRQNGQQTAVLGDHLKFDVIALNNAVGVATQAEAEAQAERQLAEEEAAAAAAESVRPTSPGGPPSPEPPFPPAMTRPPLDPAGPTSTGSGPGTSTSSTPSTSSRSATSAISPATTSEG